jgi:hypothetical protein
MATCYCPKCGSEMKAFSVGRSLQTATCEPGDMQFSPRVAAEISRHFFETDEPQTPGDMPFQLSGTWYCPRDGALLRMDGRLEPSCPSCGGVLRTRTIRQLVELHPHE